MDLYLRSVRLLRDRVPSFKEYPFLLPAVKHLESIEMTGPVTFVIGENGTGKSTLLEAIAVAWGFNPEGGSQNFNFSTQASHSSLHECLRLVRGVRQAKDGFFLRAESFYNVVTEIDRLGVIKSYGGGSLHTRSHGESFMDLVTHRFRGRGFYVLDEPEAALSPTRQMALLALMHQLVAKGSQFLIATHSPILMSYPGATILQLEAERIHKVAYEDTEHVTVTRQFLNNPTRMLKELFADPRENGNEEDEDGAR